MTPIPQPAHARAQLRAWEDSKPKNFYAADRNLQNVLAFYLGSRYPHAAETLHRFGAECATLIDPAARVEDEITNHPRLLRYNGIGERVEAVQFHPNHDLTGRLIWQSGILSAQAQPGNTVFQMALFYLLSHNGEAGHCCSIACTAGLIRALQSAAAPEIRDRFLPPLLDSDFSTMQHAAQFLTELQGGSDVGANAVRAVAADDGAWRITGEKWFCSNINADQFLVMARTARPDGSTIPGTAGLGAFVVPRRLEDGTTNGFYLRRLKDKLGTRTMASAEVDLLDAIAYPIGAPDAGFKITVELVLNTSRLMNAVSCAGMMRRAAVEAASYACAREAFGNVIASYPLVQERVADILAENYAAVSSGFYLANLLDDIETGRALEADRSIYRLFVNLNKYITSVRATDSIHHAIEVLGGNGAIESFSILPRLYRDMIVLESWEGTHNVLCLQVLRDIARYRLDQPYFERLAAMVDAVSSPELHTLTDIVRAAHRRASELLKRVLAGDSAFQQAHARRLGDSLAYLGQAVLLLREADWELRTGRGAHKQDALVHFVGRHLMPGYDPLDDTGYLPRLSRMISAV